MYNWELAATVLLSLTQKCEKNEDHRSLEIDGTPSNKLVLLNNGFYSCSNHCVVNNFRYVAHVLVIDAI